MPVDPVKRLVNLYTILHDVPKFDVHVHFEGAFDRTYAVAQFSRRRNPFRVFGLGEHVEWEEFSRVFQETARFINTGKEVVKLLMEVGGRLRRENVVYSELIVSMALLRRNGLSVSETCSSLRYGKDLVRETYNMDLQFLLGISRGDGPETADSVIAEVRKAKAQTVFCGVNLCGNEKQSAIDTEHYVDCLKRVKDLGWKISVHCGEFEPPTLPSGQGVCTAIQSIGCHRLDHAISLHHRPELYFPIKKQRIGITVCPSSNLILGRVRDDLPYPFEDYFKSGLLLAVGTDDPGYFGTTLTHEILAVVDESKLSDDDLLKLLLDATYVPFALSPQEAEEHRREIRRRWSEFQEGLT